MTKGLIVGFDGATFDVIRPLAAEGRLPNLQRMMQAGAWGPLRSTIPPVTPAAWTSFFTGKNPGKHGIYDFQLLNPADYSFSTVRSHRHLEKTLWDLLGEAGKRSLILDVPFTFPPRPLNGWMLTGYGTPRTPDTDFTYPLNLADHLPSELKDQVRVALPSTNFERSPEFIEEWRQVMTGRSRLLRYLASEQPWDLFMVVFSITDNMAHVFWTFVDPAHPNYHRPEGEHYRRAFLESYETCDRLLGELVELAGEDTTTMVLSDHGFGSVRPRQYVTQRLMRGGYLAPAAARSRSARGRLMRLATDTYMRFPFIRERVKSLRGGQLKAMKRTLRRGGLMPDSARIDYSKSVIVPTNFGLRMWVNADDRFPQGIVPAGQKDKVIEEVSAYLLADRDPVNRQQIISAVHRGQDLYRGDFIEQAPDLVIEYANFYRPEQPAGERNPHLEGGHTPDGIFLALGPDIASRPVEGATLMDLAPTILHLLGLEVPPDMDGQVLVNIFHRHYQEQHPVRMGRKPARYDSVEAVPDLTSEEEAEVLEQLRKLGYV
ncbi:MAG: alkaline phosphatase family protein [Anaerolineales bacterium]|nr:alkaline phosphatase family protein [Anaerolineales bacterium]